MKGDELTEFAVGTARAAWTFAQAFRLEGGYSRVWQRSRVGAFSDLNYARYFLSLAFRQFTPESTKSQPGKQVYYVAPDGTARVVIGPGEFAMPNGVELSPDGKTLYVNNTWQQPGENFVWAYDVAATVRCRTNGSLQC